LLKPDLPALLPLCPPLRGGERRKKAFFRLWASWYYTNRLVPLLNLLLVTCLPVGEGVVLSIVATENAVYITSYDLCSTF
jgi:hypothetical protein